MKKRSSGTSVLELEAKDEPQQPSSCAVLELQKEKEKENGQPSLMPPIPNLDDGFYEIETIRRKRLRKGQLQYLIKWRGWPETANTWEPLENLQSVPDLIDTFEESLIKSGKHRKRKRKHVVHHTQITKRLQRSTTSYSLRHFPAQTPIFPHQPHPTTLHDYDPKLSELKTTTNTGVQLDKLAIHFQQPKLSTANGHLEPIQSGRCRGAKRRKSGSVKRFKKDIDAGKPVHPHNGINMPVGAVEPGCIAIAGCMGNSSPIKMGGAQTACNIVKIIKPIGYSASLSDNMQDVLVTFMAMRSDGTEVMVDNRYLKAYNPLLLINFYEMHLRYSPTS